MASWKKEPSLCVSLSHTCNDYVAFIIESTWKDLIRVPFKNLEALTGLNIPDSSCFVSTASQKAIPLGIERNLQERKEKDRFV